MPKLVITQAKEHVDKNGKPLFDNAPGCWGLAPKKCSGPRRWTCVVQGLGRMEWCNACYREAAGLEPEVEGMVAGVDL